MISRVNILSIKCKKLSFFIALPYLNYFSKIINLIKLYSIMTSGHSLEIKGSVRIRRKGHHFFRHYSIATMLIQISCQARASCRNFCAVLVGDTLIDALPKDYLGAVSWYLFSNFWKRNWLTLKQADNCFSSSNVTKQNGNFWETSWKFRYLTIPLV